MGQRVGTALWIAPEILNGKRPTTESDVYAFGVIINEVFSRRDPYYGEDLGEILAQVANTELVPEKRPVIPADCPRIIKELIQSCWSGQPAARPKFDTILNVLQAFEPANAPGA
jgi:serine/threonine protein kinase